MDLLYNDAIVPKYYGVKLNLLLKKVHTMNKKAFDVIKNFAVVMSAVIKRVDCNLILLIEIICKQCSH